MTKNNDWPNRKILASKQFQEACVEAHNALFWMARAVNSFLSPSLNNEHLRLFWHEESCNFRTKRFEEMLQIGLNLNDLELYFCEDGHKVPHSFWMDEKTPAFVEAWYLVELLHRDVDQSKFSVHLPFDSPSMLMGDTQDHNASAFKEELKALNQCLIKSINLLKKISVARSQIKGLSFRQNEIVLEPETFSTELEIFSQTSSGKVVKIGFSIGDQLRPTPFFFVKDVNQQYRSKNRSLDYLPESICTLDSMFENSISEDKIAKDLFELAIAQA